MSERERFEKWWNRNIKTQVIPKFAAWEVWEEAIANRKPYGYGIVGKGGEGRCWFDTEDINKSMVPFYDEDHPEAAPHKAVALFYEDQS